jgi:hypothetical protein
LSRAEKSKKGVITLVKSSNDLMPMKLKEKPIASIQISPTHAKTFIEEYAELFGNGVLNNPAALFKDEK